mmetsp:Transcript_30611/g.88952  ORF Transcript_30611/g.88952 Transcript_30611/m.88952 type:complete len:113 (-) Transcript_30611:814-1152(-)
MVDQAGGENSGGGGTAAGYESARPRKQVDSQWQWREPVPRDGLPFNSCRAAITAVHRLSDQVREPIGAVHSKSKLPVKVGAAGPNRTIHCEKEAVLLPCSQGLDGHPLEGLH